MLNRKNISILIYSLGVGGAERVVSVLLDGLKDKYNIFLVLMNDTIKYDIPENTKVVYLENSNPQESGIKKLLKLPLLGWKYKKICEENRIDTSLSLMYRPNYINVLAKIFGMKSKVIISERSMPSLQQKSGLQGFINKILIKNLYKRSDIVLANSIGNSKDLKDNFGIQEVIVVNNPFDLEKIKQFYRENIHMDDSKFKFITIGRLDGWKNHKLLINAMKNIDSYLYIIGDGVLKHTLELQIKELKLEKKVFLLGQQSNPFAYFSKADCFLFGSNHEGFPNVLIEALACGLPIISTDCQSGPREILAPNGDVNFQLKDNIELAEYGILVPVNNEEKLNQAMRLMISDESMREQYSKKAIQRANDFRLKKIIKQYEEVICAD